MEEGGDFAVLGWWNKKIKCFKCTSIKTAKCAHVEFVEANQDNVIYPEVKEFYSAGMKLNPLHGH